MTPEQIQEIIDYLRSLGEVVLNKGFELALREVYVDAAECFIALIIAIVMMRLGAKGLQIGAEIIKARDERYDSDQEMWYIAGGLTGVIIGPLLALIALFNLPSLLINPQWVAIQKIFELVTGG